MKHSVLKFAISCAFAALAATQASAQDAAADYPKQVIRLIVGSAPGATTDTAGRITADVLSRTLGQPVIVQNQPGATGTISVRNTLHAKPDGYTLLFYYADQLQVAPYVFKDSPYDPIRDLAHVGEVVQSGGFILAVPPSSPATTFDEFVKYAKRAPKELSYGTWGVGSSAHLSFEMLNQVLGTKMVHVPYKGGGPSYMAAMAGEIDVVAGTSFVELLKTGKLRPLAISGNVRSPDFPQVPTLPEMGFSEQLFAPVFYGVAAPPGTPKPILDKVREALKKGMYAPEVVARLKTIAVEPHVTSAEELIAKVHKAGETYRPLVQKMGLATQ